MVSLPFFFMLFIVLFGIIGAMRGWARELLVSFSVVLALSLLSALDQYVKFYRDTLAVSPPTAQFWARAIILILLVFFGYQTPNLPRLGGARFARERLQDTLLGLFLGAFNGYLIIGTLWHFLIISGYPFQPFITPPTGDIATTADRILPWLPPRWLGVPPYTYFSVIIAFIFVIIVFL